MALAVCATAPHARAQSSASATAPSAATGPVHLSWVRGEGADECPAPAALAAAVAQQLGRDPFGAGASSRSIEAVAAREGARFVARIYVRDPRGALTGARAIGSDDATCGPLGEAAALAIALAIDPDAALRPRAPQPAVPPPPRPSAEAPRTDRAPPRCPARAPCPAPPPAPPPTAAVTVRAVGSVNLLPGPQTLAVGFSIATVGRIWGPFRWTAGAMVFPEVATPAPDDHFAFGLAAASLGACVQPLDGRVFGLAGCLALQAGAIHGVVLDAFEPVQPGDRAFVSATADAVASVRLARVVRLELGLAALVPLVRNRFRVMGRAEDAFFQPPIAGLLYLGAGVHFW